MDIIKSFEALKVSLTNSPFSFNRLNHPEKKRNQTMVSICFREFLEVLEVSQLTKMVMRPKGSVADQIRNTLKPAQRC